MSIKIATMGSCITRDNFNSKFNPYYKQFFELVGHQIHTALPSLMSEKLNITIDDSFVNQSSYAQKVILREFDKSFLDLLKKTQPDYLIMDLDPEVKFGLLRLEDNNFLTNNDKIKNLSYAKSLEYINLTENFEEYFNIWKQSVEKFFKFLKKEIPLCEVILVKGRFTDEFRDGTTLTQYRKKNNIPLLNISKMNDVWDKVDNFLIDNYDVHVLDMTREKYYLDNNHLWGPYYLHFENYFYNDFFNKLLRITYRDKGEYIEKLSKSVQRLYPSDKQEMLFNTKCVEVVLNSDKNIIELSRSNQEVYNVYKTLLKNDYILYYHNNGISKLYKRKFINELWKRNDLYQQGDIFYTIDAPLNRKENKSSKLKKLIVIFPCMPKLEVYDSYLMANRMFTKFFDGIERSLVKNVYTMRIMDLNLSHGSHFINTVNNSTMEEDISNAILRVKKELDIEDQNIVLYGASKGGTGSLYYGSKLDFKCLAVDPILNLGEYNKKDDHFLRDLRKVDISEDINNYLKSKSHYEKYIIGSENVSFNFNYISKIEGDNVQKINKIDEHIKSHPDVSRNTIPEQLMLLNKMLLDV